MSSTREARIARKTAETDITLKLVIDGAGCSSIDTGIPFFDHMLTLFSKHGLFDLEVKAVGDIEVDFHHTVEDVGIVLGQALKQAVGDKVGIVRYGWCLLPMDEALTRVALDLSGRALLVYDGPAGVDAIGGRFNFSLLEEFLRGFAGASLMNLHVDILKGRDAHHMAEATFKGLARALDMATRIDPRVRGVPSTKEVL
ncbi:MAG: imidazoleglycerol-phosphate dehydratase HisB [Verrucomicrobiales bacterium]|nr:imidazoleglycerol-phosphate dehydratase HisB [Verrucomicrobiales bacterium]